MVGQERHILITLQVEDTPLREVLDLIANQTSLNFSYSSRLINDQDPVTLQVKEGSLDKVLELVFEGRRVRFEIVERQIVLKRARRLKVDMETTMITRGNENSSMQFTISGYVKDLRTDEVLIGATISIPGGLVGTISNNYGFYSLTLKREVEQLFCSYVGYRLMVIKSIGRDNQTIHFTMEKEVARALPNLGLSGTQGREATIADLISWGAVWYPSALSLTALSRAGWK